MKTIVALVLVAAVPLTAVADNPGATSSYWKPEDVRALSASEARELADAGCKVKSFRGMDSPERNSHGPDTHDLFMLTRSEFAAKGQRDLAILCKSSQHNDQYLAVFWGGPKRCASKIPFNEGSRYYKEYGPSEAYYGEVLKPLWAAEIPRYLDGMYDQYSRLDPPPEGVVRRWRLPQNAMPVFEHDALHFSGNYNFVLYCENGKWIPLLDAFMNFVND